jgi:hypothetical protein
LALGGEPLSYPPKAEVAHLIWGGVLLLTTVNRRVASSNLARQANFSIRWSIETSTHALLGVHFWEAFLGCTPDASAFLHYWARAAASMNAATLAFSPLASSPRRYIMCPAS